MNFATTALTQSSFTAKALKRARRIPVSGILDAAASLERISIGQHPEPIMNKLDNESRKTVNRWLAEARKEMDPWMRRRYAQSIYRMVREYERATSHRKVAIHFVLRKIAGGESLDYAISTSTGSGHYFIHIGIGMGAMYTEKRIKRDELAVFIRGLGTEVFPLRALWAEATRILEQRRAKQSSLSL
jgi:hypothetical protein